MYKQFFGRGKRPIKTETPKRTDGKHIGELFRQIIGRGTRPQPRKESNV